MKGPLTGLVGKARQLETAIRNRIESRTPARPRGDRQPLEVLHAIVHSVEQEVQPAGRGRLVFPYGQIRIWITAATARDRARLAAACEGPPSLDERVRERLTALHCDVSDLQVKTTFTAAGKDDWEDPAFHIDYARLPSGGASSDTAVRLDLSVLQGTAERSNYAFAMTTVSIGRGAEVRDARDRLIRTNQVAFAEGAGDVNASVSRRHAHITRTADGFRLYDDGSSQGTSVLRDGRDVPVTRARGVRLRSADVIVLGQARIRVKVS